MALAVKNPPASVEECKRRRFSLWVRKIPWRRKWQPTLVFLPGRFRELRSLVGYSPWGLRESDMTGQLSSIIQHIVFQTISRKVT